MPRTGLEYHWIETLVNGIRKELMDITRGMVTLDPSLQTLRQQVRRLMLRPPTARNIRVDHWVPDRTYRARRSKMSFELVVMV